MEIKLAKYIAGFLADYGIRDCFLVTGGGAMHLDDAIGHEERIHCTFNHHEQACAIAAEGYTRMTGKLAAVCVTSGPGGTNAMTGVMGGWLDSIPMFVVSGQVKRETTIWACSDLNLRQLGDQEFNVIDSVRNMTKYAVMVTNPQEIAYHLEKALYLATDGRGGPVWLDIPLDVQGAKIETESLIHFHPEQEFTWGKPEVRPSAIALLTDWIRQAKAPLVLAGTGINLGGAREKLLRFLKKYQVSQNGISQKQPLLLKFPWPLPEISPSGGSEFSRENSGKEISLGNCHRRPRSIWAEGYDRRLQA